MAELRRRDGGNLLDAHVNDGRRPKQQSASALLARAYVQAASWISDMVVVLSHTINLPRVFMSLTS